MINNDMFEALKNALMSFDPNNDSYWIENGKPNMKAIAYIDSNLSSLTRKDVDEAFPNFNRENVINGTAWKDNTNTTTDDTTDANKSTITEANNPDEATTKDDETTTTNVNEEIVNTPQTIDDCVSDVEKSLDNLINLTKCYDESITNNEYNYEYTYNVIIADINKAINALQNLGRNVAKLIKAEPDQSPLQQAMVIRDATQARIKSGYVETVTETKIRKKYAIDETKAKR